MCPFRIIKLDQNSSFTVVLEAGGGSTQKAARGPGFLSYTVTITPRGDFGSMLISPQMEVFLQPRRNLVLP